MNYREEIRQFVENECLKDTSNYGYEPYVFHFIPVVKYGKLLSDKLGGDDEIIEIAAWLHDIGSIVEGRENHHVSGSNIAVKKLKELGYPDSKIEIIRNCILNHRGSIHNNRATIEEQIVAEADTLSNFENIGGLFKAAFIYEKLDQKLAQESILRKLENKYSQLHFEESKILIEPKYKAAIVLLKTDN